LLRRVGPSVPNITDDVRMGELGRMLDPQGRMNTELSTTVTDPRVNGGRATNIPTMVHGQVGVSELQRGLMSDDQYEIAIRRALERARGGGLPMSYPSIEAAIRAAEGRPESEKVNPYMRDPRFLLQPERKQGSFRPVSTTGIRG
jgi:hypothetical protein